MYNIHCIWITNHNFIIDKSVHVHCIHTTFVVINCGQKHSKITDVYCTCNSSITNVTVSVKIKTLYFPESLKSPDVRKMSVCARVFCFRQGKYIHVMYVPNKGHVFFLETTYFVEIL